MAGREQNRLGARFVETVTKPGNYIDGRGLRLRVQENGAKSWVFRFSLHGREQEMGLGPKEVVSLAQARVRANALRLQVLDGINPKEARAEKMREAKLAEAKAISFKDCAEAYIKAHRAEWKNEKHAAQWGNTLATYCYPTFGDLPVSKIDTGLVVKVLEEIWTTKTETASRVQGRIASVLSWATAHGYREGENPARWKDHLDNILPAPSKVAEERPEPALPYSQISAFMTDLRKRDALAARALEMLILTAVRTNNVITMNEREVDLAKALWVIPGEKMKTGKEHRVPLSPAALKLLRATEPDEDGNYFPLSNGAMLALLKRMNYADDPKRAKYIDPKQDGRAIVPHGFRSTFSDWVSEATGHSSEVREMALAHTIKNKADAAYRRGGLFEKRALLMNDWARFCELPPAKGEVVPMRRRKA